MEPKDLIKKYMYDRLLDKKLFAVICHISLESVYSYLAGRPISYKSALKIEKGTRRALLAKELATAQIPKKVLAEWAPHPLPFSGEINKRSLK